MSKAISEPVPGSSGADVSDLQHKFVTLADTWNRKTTHFSSTRQMAECPAYREIVSLGRPVVPLIFRELVREPSFRWFHALRDILGSGPEIPAEARGKLGLVTERWLRWGKELGIYW
jgi:hypothetical protein